MTVRPRCCFYTEFANHPPIVPQWAGMPMYRGLKRRRMECSILPSSSHASLMRRLVELRDSSHPITTQ